MSAPPAWNWQPGPRPALSLAALADTAELIELCPSPDGTRLAAVVADGDGMRLRILGPGADDVVQWPETWERVRQLRWSDDGKLAALIGQDFEWTVVEDGEAWSESYEFVWDLRRRADGGTVAAVKTDEGYTPACGGRLWERRFPMIREFCLAPGAPQRVACTVQAEPRTEADVAAFAAGLWSLAIDGQLWPRRFVNVWEPVLSLDGERAAALVRLSRTDHTVAVDGEPWGRTFDCAWGPSFTPTGAVVAPVKADGGWTLACDGQPVWDRRFVQLWRQRVDARGEVVAVAAPEFGRWTVVRDGRCWQRSWDEWVGTPVTAPGSDRRVAAAVKDGGRWAVAVDGEVWNVDGSRLQGPVIAGEGGAVVAAVERDGLWRLAVDGRMAGPTWARLWPLAVSPDGRAVLVRGLDEQQQYLSQVVDLAAERSSS